MSVYIIFGLPGAGKTYVGWVFEKYFKYFFYDGDDELSEEMKQAIASKTVFTNQMRDAFFENLINKIDGLTKEHEKLVIAQTFIKEKYRMDLMRQIPQAKFLLVQADKEIRELRLTKRNEYPLDLEYARKMVHNFEEPEIPPVEINNDEEGIENLKEQIGRILQNQS